MAAQILGRLVAAWTDPLPFTVPYWGSFGNHTEGLESAQSLQIECMGIEIVELL